MTVTINNREFEANRTGFYNCFLENYTIYEIKNGEYNLMGKVTTNDVTQAIKDMIKEGK